MVEIWHCNENGVYDNTSDDYVYRAAAKTGADGKYHFRTIMPVPYNAGLNNIRPAHFHMRISERSNAGSRKHRFISKVIKYNETDSALLIRVH